MAAKSRKASKVETVETVEAIETVKPVSGGYFHSEIPAKEGNFIVLAAQNNTDIHPEFWAQVKQYADRIGCEIVVCPILYNKNAWAQPDDTSEGALWFDPIIKPYMVENRVYLNGSLLVANAHVLPTAKNPLSGFQGAGNAGEYVIIPASKIALECMPALKGQDGKVLLSTGTVTKKNYVQRKAGMVAELSHNFGFVICEAGKNPRSVEFVNGQFFDFDGDEIYSSIMNNCGEIGLVLGDIHAEKCADSRIAKMLAIVYNLNPDRLFLHDVLDFTSRNHHNRKNHFFRYGQDLQGASVKSDIATVCNVLEQFQGMTRNVTVIQSNHDLALNRWLEEADYREDTVNAEIYLTLALDKLRAIQAGIPFDALACAVQMPEVHFNGTDESLLFNGVEVGNHGDKGPNGARGSIKAFEKIGASMVIGHSHTPGICGAVYQVGVGGNLEMGYNEGPSSWKNAHCIIYPNGQKQLVIE